MQELANSHGPFPITLAISGHRDIHPDDCDLVQSTLTELFTFLKNRFPLSEIHLLSGLAEGSERIAARAALKTPAVHLVPVLAMSQDKCLEDFTTQESQLEFTSMLSQAGNRIREPDFSAGVGQPLEREDRYRMLGDYLIRNSHLLIAIWDGKQNERRSGTAHVVELANKFQGHSFFSTLELGLPEKKEVLFIPVRRRDSLEAATSNDNNKVRERINELLGKHSRLTETLRSIERSNRDAVALGHSTNPNVANSQINLFGPYAEVSARDERLLQLGHYYSTFDCLAILNQEKRGFKARLLLATLVLALALREVYAGPASDWDIALMSIGLFVITWCVYYLWFGTWSNKAEESNEKRYLDYRLAAEALRIQIFWNVAGITRNIADSYWAAYENQLATPRAILRGVLGRILDSKPTSRDEKQPETSAERASRHELIREQWLKSQLSYFTRKKIEQQQLSACLNRLIGYFFWLGMLVFIIVAYCDTAYRFPSEAYRDFKLIVLLVSTVFLITAAACKTYGKLMAYDEHQQRYDRMQVFFERVLEAFDKARESGSDTLLKQHLETAGLEASMETTSWAVLNNLHAFSPTTMPK